MVSTQAKRVAALVHVHWAKSEAENVVFAGLAWALTIAFAIDQLLVMATLGLHFETWLNAGAVVVDHAIGAHWCANVALSHDKAGRARWEPLGLTFLAVLALLCLTVASPKRKGLFTSSFSLLEELGAVKLFHGD